MPVPLALPLVLLGGGGLIAAAAGASGKKKKKAKTLPGQPGGTTYTLDANMPAQLRDQVLAALAGEKDPNKLEAFATSIASVFPLSAAALRAKAALIRASQPQPSPPAPTPAPPVPLLPGQLPQIQNVDPGFPPEFIPALQTVYQDTDPARIEAYATTLGMAWPVAASLLRARAAQLRASMPQPAPQPAPPVPTPPPSMPDPLQPGQIPQLNNLDAGFPADLLGAYQAVYQNPDPAMIEAYATPLAPAWPVAASLLRARAAQLRAVPPAPAPAPIPPTPIMPPPAPVPQPPGPTPSLPNVIPPAPLAGLDPGMPVEMQKAVLGALTTEGDAAKLQGFAQSIQAQYPIAAGLLMAKANALLLVKPAPLPTPPSPPQPGPIVPPPVPPMPRPPALYPIGDASTHSGRNAGRPTGQFPFVVLGTKGPGNAPITIAKYGAGDEAEWPKLKPLNPQYRFGVEPEFIGQALNVPWEWAPKLATVGYTVQQDAGAAPPVLASTTPRPALPAAKGGTHASHP